MILPCRNDLDLDTLGEPDRTLWRMQDLSTMHHTTRWKKWTILPPNIAACLVASFPTNSFDSVLLLVPFLPKPIT